MSIITNKQLLAQDVKRLDIQAESIASKIRPGQFVIIVPQEKSEWIPMSVAESDPHKGTISIIFKEIGDATRELGNIPINDSLYSVMGPFGQPATIEKRGTVICVATGVGIAQILPICRALKKAGNKVIGVIGAKTKKDLILETQMRLTCYKLQITTEQGYYMRRGKATDAVQEIINKEKISLVYATGSVEMMKVVCDMTKKKHIKTLVQVNTNIQCGAGICGACRAKVNEQVVFSCIDGPEFDGHSVDFDYLKTRKKASTKCLDEQAAEDAGKGFFKKLVSSVIKES